MKLRDFLERPLRPQANGANGAASLRDGVHSRPRVAAGALALTILVALLVLMPFSRDTDRKAGHDRSGIRTTTVKRLTLVERESVEGTLGYAGARTVVNRLTSDDGASGASGSGGRRSGPDGSGADSQSGSSEGSGSGLATSAAQHGRAGKHGDRNEKRGAGQGSRDGGSSSAGRDSSGGGATGGGDTVRQGSGTVTGLAREGTTVDRGEPLYELDNRPVVLMYGRVPAYRTLSTATTNGPDVRQLERNLVALGFGAGVTVDEHFSVATAAGVRRWQRSLGLPETGRVELGRVVFLPGARRVGSHKTKLGSVAATGAEVLDTTSVRRVVKVELDVAKQSLVERGDRVTVTLPDGTTVAGRIARVGRVAHKKDAAADDGAPGTSGSDSGELVIDLSIVLRSHRGVSRLDQAPVTVGIAQETRRRALAVPVTALLARPGGGYGVEVVRGGRRRVVAVETGLFANGLVEISGRGIGEGTQVAIPEEA